jgi:hypothetical protein
MRIERSPALSIARKYAALTDQLQKSRLETLGALSVTEEGSIKIDARRPGTTALNARLGGLDGKLNRLVDIAAEYGKVLDAIGAAPDEDLNRRLDDLRDETNISPAAWQLFIMLHDGNRLLLPGEIMSNPEYQSLEKELRAKKAKAEKQIEPVRATIHKISALAEEAAAL